MEEDGHEVSGFSSNVRILYGRIVGVVWIEVK